MVMQLAPARNKWLLLLTAEAATIAIAATVCHSVSRPASHPAAGPSDVL